MKKYLVLFMTPVAVLEDWMKTPAGERKEMEDKMSAEWKEWMQANSTSLVEAPAGAGKTKVVSSDGITDTKNEVMMYSIVQADSHEDAAKMFVGHTHLQIPEATIEIMEINPLRMNG